MLVSLTFLKKLFEKNRFFKKIQKFEVPSKQNEKIRAKSDIAVDNNW